MLYLLTGDGPTTASLCVAGSCDALAMNGNRHRLPPLPSLRPHFGALLITASDTVSRIRPLP